MGLRWIRNDPDYVSVTEMWLPGPVGESPYTKLDRLRAEKKFARESRQKPLSFLLDPIFALWKRFRGFVVQE